MALWNWPASGIRPPGSVDHIRSEMAALRLPQHRHAEARGEFIAFFDTPTSAIRCASSGSCSGCRIRAGARPTRSGRLSHRAPATYPDGTNRVERPWGRDRSSGANGIAVARRYWPAPRCEGPMLVRHLLAYARTITLRQIRGFDPCSGAPVHGTQLRLARPAHFWASMSRWYTTMNAQLGQGASSGTTLLAGARRQASRRVPSHADTTRAALGGAAARRAGGRRGAFWRRR